MCMKELVVPAFTSTLFEWITSSCLFKLYVWERKEAPHARSLASLGLGWRERDMHVNGPSKSGSPSCEGVASFCDFIFRILGL